MIARHKKHVGGRVGEGEMIGADVAQVLQRGDFELLDRIRIVVLVSALSPPEPSRSGLAQDIARAERGRRKAIRTPSRPEPPVFAAGLRLCQPGGANSVEHARRETEQEEKNEAPRRRAEEPVCPISKSGADRKPRDEFGRYPHRLAESLAARPFCAGPASGAGSAGRSARNRLRARRGADRDRPWVASLSGALSACGLASRLCFFSGSDQRAAVALVKESRQLHWRSLCAATLPDPLIPAPTPRRSAPPSRDRPRRSATRRAPAW